MNSLCKYVYYIVYSKPEPSIYINGQNWVFDICQHILLKYTLYQIFMSISRLVLKILIKDQMSYLILIHISPTKLLHIHIQYVFRLSPSKLFYQNLFFADTIIWFSSSLKKCWYKLKPESSIFKYFVQKVIIQHFQTCHNLLYRNANYFYL